MIANRREARKNLMTQDEVELELHNELEQLQKDE